MVHRWPIERFCWVPTQSHSAEPTQTMWIGVIYIYIYIFYQKFGDAHEPRAKLEPVLAAAVCAVEADYTMWQTAPVLRKIKI